MFNLQNAVQEGALSQMLKDAIASIDYEHFNNSYTNFTDGLDNIGNTEK